MLPVGDLPHGLTKTYTVPSDAADYEYEVVAVYHNANDSTETFSTTLLPPRYDPSPPVSKLQVMLRTDSVTVPPGETCPIRVRVDTAESSEGQGVWTVDGRPAPLVTDSDAE